MEQAAWWFHGAKFQLGNGPKWGSQSPLTSFARGSKDCSYILTVEGMHAVNCCEKHEPISAGAVFGCTPPVFSSVAVFLP